MAPSNQGSIYRIAEQFIAPNDRQAPHYEIQPQICRWSSVDMSVRHQEKHMKQTLTFTLLLALCGISCTMPPDLGVVRRAKQGASYQMKDLIFQNLASRNYRVLQLC